MATTLNVLTIIQEFCRRKLIPVPSVVATATDDAVLQLWGFLNEAAKDIAKGDWQSQHIVATFQHANGTGKLALDFNTPVTVSPNLSSSNTWTIRSLIRDTLWDSTNELPVRGPVSNAEWQAMLIQGVTPSVYSYRIQGAGLCIYPVPSPTSSVTFSAEFLIHEPFVKSDGTAYYMYSVADTNYTMLPEDLIMAALTWRWSKSKGYDWEADFKLYQDMYDRYQAGEGQAQALSLNGTGEYPPLMQPGILIPAGNWTP